jgi:hypothetical protein
LRRGKWFSLNESEGVMKRFNFQPEDDLRKAIFEIIASYQEIKGIDIWFELGEDERFRGTVSRSEVNEALSWSEGRKLIRKGKDEKWR